MTHFSRTKDSMQLIAIFCVYACISIIFGFAYRYVINPDGVSELRMAGYLAEGHFLRSVTSGYSPLNIWIISPFLYLGLDGLSASRIAMALQGAGMLLCCWFMASRFELTGYARFVAILIAALLISFFTIQFIGPDVLFAALILLYLYLATEPDVITRRRQSFICGLSGGVAYLAHHNAFPFVLVHFPIMLVLRAYIDRERDGIPWKNVLVSWGSGMAGLLIIVTVWGGIVSVKYGHLVISSKGGAAHAIMGPDDVDRRHPFFVGGLFKPRDEYAVHVFEDPSDVKFKTWSPFASRAYFMHQITVIKKNAGYVFNHFVNNSPFFTYAFVIGVLVLIPVAFFLHPMDERKRFLYSWVVMTFIIYCSGFLLIIARSPRRFYPLMIIFTFLSFHFIEEIMKGMRDMLSERRMRTLTFYLLLIAVAAFSLKPGIRLLRAAEYVITNEQINPYREIAEQINTVRFPAPYAMIRSSQKPHTDTFISYYLKKQFLGRPLSTDVEGITRELRSAGARSLLVFDNPEITERLKQDMRYTHVASIKLNGNKRYESVVNFNIRDHEIVTGWDNEVNIFTLD